MEDKPKRKYTKKKKPDAPKEVAPEVINTRAKSRKCLRCKLMFDSSGPENRICDGCRTYRGVDIMAVGSDSDW